MDPQSLRRRARLVGLSVLVGVASALALVVVFADSDGPEVETAVLPTATPVPTATPLPTPTPEPTPAPSEVAFHAADVEGLPQRYVAFGRDGVLYLVQTATGEAEALFQGSPWGPSPYIEGIAVHPSGEEVYVATDPDLTCAGSIVRVPLGGGPREAVAIGGNPSISPTGHWLVYTIDGARARNQDPPAVGNSTAPCRHRHDSYVWRDLASAEEVTWKGPKPTTAMATYPSGAALRPGGFDPATTRMLLIAEGRFKVVSVVTPTDPVPEIDRDDLDDLEVAISADGLVYGVQWTFDGSILVTTEEGDLELPSPAVNFVQPEGLRVLPVDASQDWLLVSGAGATTDFPGEYAATWAWNQIDPPIQLASQAIVAWLPDAAPADG